MLDNKFKFFEDKIETKIENRILGLESELQRMEATRNRKTKPRKETINLGGRGRRKL